VHWPASTCSVSVKPAESVRVNVKGTVEEMNRSPASLQSSMYPVCGGPTGSSSNVTTLTPGPAVTLTALLETGVDDAFELRLMPATATPAGPASETLIREPGGGLIGKLPPAVSGEAPAVATTFCAPRVKLNCLPWSAVLLLHLQTLIDAAACAFTTVTAVS